MRPRRICRPCNPNLKFCARHCNTTNDRHGSKCLERPWQTPSSTASSASSQQSMHTLHDHPPTISPAAAVEVAGMGSVSGATTRAVSAKQRDATTTYIAGSHLKLMCATPRSCTGVCCLTKVGDVKTHIMPHCH
jgi:hypothetical protein